MARLKLKVRLLQFVAKKLRTWAISIERNVAREQAAVEDPEILQPRGDGPPQHWIDLVQEKAPELLSLPRTKPQSARLIREVTSANSDVSGKREQRTERSQIEESQLKPMPLKYAKRPDTLRSRTIAKARDLTRSKFTLRPAREPAERKHRESEQIQAGESRAGKLTTEAQSHREERPRRRSSDRYESTVEPRTRNSSAKANAATEEVVFRRAKGEVRSDAGFDYVEPRVTRPVARESAPISSEHAKREVEADQPAIVKSNRPPHGSTLEPRPGRVVSFTIEPSEETSHYPRERVPSLSLAADLSEEATKRKRITIDPAPLQVNNTKHTLLPTTAEAHRTVEKVSRNVPTTIDYSSARTPHRRFAQEQFEKAQVNVPALLDEDTMSDAAAAQWTKTAEHENPWPDLPSPPPVEVEEQLAAHTRELDRYRRLELEQRGTLWNE